MYTLSNGNAISVAFFDFDDTLAIHNNWGDMEKNDRVTFYQKALENPDEFYETVMPCIVNTHLVKFIHNLKVSGVKLYCLSGMYCSLNAAAKLAFIRKHYSDDFELLTSSSQDAKQIVLDALSPDPSQVLLVDDYMPNLEKASAFGYNCYTPTLEVFMFNEQKTNFFTGADVVGSDYVSARDLTVGCLYFSGQSPWRSTYCYMGRDEDKNFVWLYIGNEKEFKASPEKYVNDPFYRCIEQTKSNKKVRLLTKQWSENLGDFRVNWSEDTLRRLYHI